MKPTIRVAQRACEAAKARQAIVVWFDEHGQFAVASYGETKAECSTVKPVCIAIGDMLDSGYLERPGHIESDEPSPDMLMRIETLNAQGNSWKPHWGKLRR